MQVVANPTPNYPTSIDYEGRDWREVETAIKALHDTAVKGLVREASEVETAKQRGAIQAFDRILRWKESYLKATQPQQ